VQIEIDESVLRRLLHDQHPDLAGLPLARVAGGWDNQMWRLGGELALRIPRTPRADSLLRREWRWLPALHTEAPAQAPNHPIRGVPLSAVTDHFHERLDAVIVDVDGVRHVWEQALAAPEWVGPPLWLHADLHPANIVTAGGRLAGVIDFGELCAGDPATDLAAAWMLLPPGGASRFLAAYGNLDRATIIRARGWAVLFALGLIAIGNAGDRGLPGGKPTWGPAGRRTLDRVLQPHD
jgi:aminoglycoside phosphotransferase (APT) family kinase protein